MWSIAIAVVMGLTVEAPPLQGVEVARQQSDVTFLQGQRVPDAG